MNFPTLAIGGAAFLFGIATFLVRLKSPEKFRKLGPMQEKFGRVAGYAIHAVF